jgi:hypothetical protein
MKRRWIPQQPSAGSMSEMRAQRSWQGLVKKNGGEFEIAGR